MSETSPNSEPVSSFEELRKQNEILQEQNKSFSYVLNQVFSRELFSRGMPAEVNTAPINRDYYQQFGYPQQISKLEYQSMYDRMPVANRIVQLFPLECWQTSPQVYDKDSPTTSEFEKQFNKLERQMSFWGLLRRADILSGIGAFGIVVFGLDDNKPLVEPVDGYDEGEIGQHKLLYLRAFPHSMVEVSQFNRDRTSPRFGLPEFYQITPSNNRNQLIDSALHDMTTVTVHWTRVLHIADNAEVSEIYGVPRLQLVYNLLMDVTKVLGCSGEMFYKGTYPGYSIETTEGQLPMQIDVESLKRRMAEFENGYQRWIMLQNAKINALPSMYSEPSGLMEQYLKMISVALAVPQRILEGSERGELASGQDAVLWAIRLQERRKSYLIPYLVRPFINRLIRYGTVPQPFHQDYSIVWEGAKLDLKEAALTKADTETSLLQRYFDGELSRVMSPTDYLTRYCDMTEEEATALVQRAQKYNQEAAARMVMPKTEEP
jgi:hypothetical protein